MNNYRDNLEIDLKDLAGYILKFWKSIILFALIGVVLGGAFSFAKGYISQDNTAAETESPYSGLNDKQIQEVELALDTYKTFQQTRETVKSSLQKDLEAYNSEGNIDHESAESLYYKVQTLNTTSMAQLSGGGSVYGSLNADQKKAFDQKINRENNPISAVKVTSTAPIKDMIKKSILSAIALVFLYVVFLALKYILSPKLKTVDDLKAAFKLPILGTITKKTDGGLAVICSSIMALITTGKAKNIILCSTLSDGTVADYITRITEFLKEKSVTSNVALGIISDPNSIDKVADSDGLVFFESIGESTYENIDKEVAMANNLGIKVLGSVVVK